MLITVERNFLEQVQAESLIVPTFEDRQERRFGADALVGSGEITGKLLEFTLIYNPPTIAAKRVLLVGVGKSTEFTGVETRKAAGAAVRFLRGKSIKNVAF